MRKRLRLLYRGCCGDLRETVFVSVDDQFQPVTDAEFVENRSKVMPHCFLRNKQPFSYLFVSAPLAEACNNLEFTRGQARNFLFLRIPSGWSASLCKIGHHCGNERPI